MANVRLAIGRPATAVSRGGASCVVTGRSVRIVGFAAIAVLSSRTKTPSKEFEYAPAPQTAIAKPAAHVWRPRFPDPPPRPVRLSGSGHPRRSNVSLLILTLLVGTD